MFRARYSHSAGGVVMHEYTGNILVVAQRNNTWSLPKGHIERDEDPLVTAKREIFEESGVTDVRLIMELGKYKRFKIGRYSKDDESVIKDIRMYLFTSRQDTLLPHDPHNPEARWVHPDEVAKLLTHKKDGQFFESVRQFLPPVPEDENK